MTELRRLDSALVHLWVTSLTFLRLSHLYLHFCQVEPEIINEMNSQSYFICMITTIYEKWVSYLILIRCDTNHIKRVMSSLFQLRFILRLRSILNNSLFTCWPVFKPFKPLPPPFSPYIDLSFRSTRWHKSAPAPFVQQGLLQQICVASLQIRVILQFWCHL